MIEAVSHLLERPVAYHGILAKALRSVPSAVMLSQGIYWQRLAESKGQEWFWVTIEDWYDQTGITPESQQTARKTLRAAGVWEEKLMGVPAKMHYKIDVTALVAVINRYLETGKPVTVDYRNKLREKPRTGNGKFRQQDKVDYRNIEIIKDSKRGGETNSATTEKKSPPPAVENLSPLEADFTLSHTGGAAAGGPVPEIRDAAKPQTPASGPGLPPWGEYPNANTPRELKDKLAAFYKRFPEEFRWTKDGTPAMAWSVDKIREVMSGFCEHAITSGWKWDYRQFNSRLKTWFREQPLHEKQRAGGYTTTPSPVVAPAPVGKFKYE